MKKHILLVVMAIFLGSYAKAQDNLTKAEFELYQSIYGMEKKSVMKDYIDIDPAIEKTFWELYDQYEAERTEIGKVGLKLLYDYIENYENISDEKLTALMKEVISKRKKTEKLLNKYYKQIFKQTSPHVASKFYQLENYFSSLIRISITESLPFIQKKQLGIQ